MKITVRPTDTYLYYSQLFDVSLILIEHSNPGVNANQLITGQTIQIPGYSHSCHQITRNDTLNKIASKHNFPADLLLLTNPNIDFNNLKTGQRINIPQRIKEFVISDFNNYTFDKMVQDLNKLLTIYPFITRQIIGHSVMGKDLIELQIGNGDEHVHINGAFHANEWITTSTIMRYINDYAVSLTNNRPIHGMDMFFLYNKTRLSIVPMVNPDGVNLVLNGALDAGVYQDKVLTLNNQHTDFSNWKANIVGVDLNNQYPARWETESERKPDSPRPRDFTGVHPLSEPEAIAMAELVRNRNFLRVTAFHTQGEEIYWGFEGNEPQASQKIVEEYSRVSGYKAIQYIDNYAGFKDWFIQAFRRPGFTIELGSGTNPLPFEQFTEIYQKSIGILLANLYL